MRRQSPHLATIRAVLAAILIVAGGPAVVAAAVRNDPGDARAGLGLPQPAWDLSCVPLLANGDFEAGPGAAWSEQSAGGYALVSDQFPHGGEYGAWLGGDDSADDTLSQSATIPGTASRVTLVYWWAIHTLEEAHPHDVCTVELRDAQGGLIRVLETITDAADPDVWHRREHDLTQYKGRTVRLVFHAITDLTNPTDFFFDDVALEACDQSTARSVHLPLILKVHLGSH